MQHHSNKSDHCGLRGLQSSKWALSICRKLPVRVSAEHAPHLAHYVPVWRWKGIMPTVFPATVLPQPPCCIACIAKGALYYPLRVARVGHVGDSCDDDRQVGREVQDAARHAALSWVVERCCESHSPFIWSRDAVAHAIVHGKGEPSTQKISGTLRFTGVSIDAVRVMV